MPAIEIAGLCLPLKPQKEKLTRSFVSVCRNKQCFLLKCKLALPTNDRNNVIYWYRSTRVSENVMGYIAQADHNGIERNLDCCPVKLSVLKLMVFFNFFNFFNIKIFQASTN